MGPKRKIILEINHTTDGSTVKSIGRAEYKTYDGYLDVTLIIEGIEYGLSEKSGKHYIDSNEQILMRKIYSTLIKYGFELPERFDYRFNFVSEYIPLNEYLPLKRKPSSEEKGA